MRMYANGWEEGCHCLEGELAERTLRTLRGLRATDDSAEASRAARGDWARRGVVVARAEAAVRGVPAGPGRACRCCALNAAPLLGSITTQGCTVSLPLPTSGPRRLALPVVEAIGGWSIVPKFFSEHAY